MRGGPPLIVALAGIQALSLSANDAAPASESRAADRPRTACVPRPRIIAAAASSNGSNAQRAHPVELLQYARRMWAGVLAAAAKADGGARHGYATRPDHVVRRARRRRSGIRSRARGALRS